MRRSSLFVAAAALFISAANLSAQTVNFSGTWTPVVDPNAPAPQGGRGGGQAGPMTITMDAKTMTITTTRGGNEQKSVYNLDGSDSKNMMAAGGRQGGGTPTEVVSKAKLDGGKVIISTTRDFNGTSNTTTVTYWLDGGKLVSSSIGSQPGRDGAAPVARVTTYTKS